MFKNGKHDVQKNMSKTPDLKENTEGFDAFFSQVLMRMPAQSAALIRSSLEKTKVKAESFVNKNSQKFDHLFDEFLVGLDEKTRKKCHETIHFATLAAAIVAFSPIPFSDALLLVPIQLTMMLRLHKIFGASWSEGLAQGITKELVVVSLGRSVVGNTLKFIPAVGTVTGGLINATVATTITETLGWVTVKMLNEGEDIFNNVLTFEGQFKNLLKKAQKLKKKS
nr:YcjF family protein [Lactococcus sp. S-13]